MTSLFGHFLPKNDQMTQNNALYSNKQNVPNTSNSRTRTHKNWPSIDWSRNRIRHIIVASCSQTLFCGWWLEWRGRCYGHWTCLLPPVLWCHLSAALWSLCAVWEGGGGTDGGFTRCYVLPPGLLLAVTASGYLASSTERSQQAPCSDDGIVWHQL